MTDWIDAQFRDYVVPEVFGRATRSDRPVWIAVGGAPGSGKTAAQLHVRALNPGVSLVSIIGDDLRFHHPDYERLLETDPLSMPAATAGASAAWVEASLEYAKQNRYSVLVEGTFRRPEVTLGTAAAFHEAGFRTHLVALAVQPWESRLSTLERFVTDHVAGRAARWTPVEAHDAGVAGTPKTLAAAAASADVDQITVVNRAGVVLFDATRPAALTGAVGALLDAHDQPPTRDELRSWSTRLADNSAYLDQNLPSTPETRALLEALGRDERTLQAAVSHPTRASEALNSRASRSTHLRPRTRHEPRPSPGHER